MSKYLRGKFEVSTIILTIFKQGTHKTNEPLKSPPRLGLANIKIKKYYQSQPKFNGVYSRNNLPRKIKDGAYGINLDEHADAGAHWIALYVLHIEIICFDSFGVEHVPKEIWNFIENKNIKTNLYRIWSSNSIMCGYFCIGFIDFMVAGKTSIDYASLFSPYDFEKMVR